MKLETSLTSELIEFSIIGKLHIGPGVVLSYLIYLSKEVKSWNNTKHAEKRIQSWHFVDTFSMLHLDKSYRDLKE